MKVLCIYSDVSGCGHYRIFSPARAAKLVGIDVSVSEGLPTRQVYGAVNLAVDAIEADVVVIQRPMLGILVDLIPELQAAGIGVVMEIDDDVTCLAPNHQSFNGLHPKYNPEFNWHHLKRAAKMADIITVSTHALAERFGRGKSVIVKNCIDEELLHTRSQKRESTVGWAGAIGTHPNDLQVTGWGVARAVQECGADFVVVGQSEGVREALGLTYRPQETGWLPIEEYYSAVSALEVGIVPLESSKFNEAKSNLKGLEYAALGVPFIAAPLPEYVKLLAEGAGLIAHKPREWERYITKLLQDPGYAEELRGVGEQVIRDYYMINDNIHTRIEAWEMAAQARGALI